MAMRSALVTGAHGFVGRHLVAHLRRRGVQVTTLGRRVAEEPHHIAIDDGDWTSPAIDRALRAVEPQCIFHLAGLATGTPAEINHVNVDLVQGLLGALRRTGMRSRLVVTGSAAEYGASVRDGEPASESDTCAPQSIYGNSKLCQTRAVLDHAEATGASTLVVRLFNAIGADMPKHLALGDFARQIAHLSVLGGTLKVGNIDVGRDMIDVDVAADLLYHLAENDDARGIVNVCSGEAPLLRELVGMLIDSSGREVRIEVDGKRVRPNEIRLVIGSTQRLARLAFRPQSPDFRTIVRRLWETTKVPDLAA